MGRAELEDFIARARGSERRDELDTAAVTALSGLEAAGIEALLLKGPALARHLYGDRENRAYADIDLLIAPRDLSSARDVLIELGYVPATEVFGIEDVAEIQHSEVWGRSGERGAPVWIDLHWTLEGCDVSGDHVWDALVSSRSSIELAGMPAAILGEDGLALHLAIHAAQHGRDDTKAMADLERGLRRWPPDVWRAAANLAEVVRSVPAFAAGLRMLPEGARLAGELGLPPTT